MRFGLLDVASIGNRRANLLTHTHLALVPATRLWRRTTLEQYRKDEPGWEILIDLDVPALEEAENRVWAGVAWLEPEGERCLVSLSLGGADARVVREFDVESRR